ncbi:MAG: N-acetylneuraminate synthase family protein [Ignavibacteriaceae bacterium]|nr:N-acetylneuraminate synthase family protein [Ignavibacteriaceae bacterium]
MRSIEVGKVNIGDGHPVFIVAEIGINHNGSLDIAKKLIEGAKAAGCDAVKFQKRTPEICVPKDQWNIERDTPWGRMTYIEEAVDFIEEFDVPIYKTASASLTDKNLLLKHKKLNKPTIISTGMSTMAEIEEAVNIFSEKNLLIAHSTSSYPCPNEELNLKMITTLREKYPQIPIGYSGHETGLAPTWSAVSLGASFVERHITLDRAMWGSDQAASVEPNGFNRLVRNIRDIEIALGDGIKRVYPSEMSARTKLRRVK